MFYPFHSLPWGGLYCPPVIPAELCQSSAKLRWFSEVEVGRWASAEVGPGLDQD